MRDGRIQGKKIRIIDSSLLRQVTAELCIKANTILRKDVQEALRKALKLETKKIAKNILMAIIYNSVIAKEKKLAVCQDTGLPIVFLSIGQDVHIKGDLYKAVNNGIKDGYKQASLRNSIVFNPLNRNKIPSFSPGIIHFDIIKGNKLKITVLPKGFGCENKSRLKMFNPTADLNDVKNFIIDTVKQAGPDACPPYIVGVGIGGTADYASLLAKKALLEKINHGSRLTAHELLKLERDLLKEINKLNIGPMGLGGKTTVLALNIRISPTHIAGLPVSVNISCHALRSATKVI